MAVHVDQSLAADAFGNRQSAHVPHRSVAQSQHVAIARDGNRVVGTACLLTAGFAGRDREVADVLR